MVKKITFIKSIRSILVKSIRSGDKNLMFLELNSIPH